MPCLWVLTSVLGAPQASELTAQMGRGSWTERKEEQVSFFSDAGEEPSLEGCQSQVWVVTSLCPILWSDWPWLHLVRLSLSVIGHQNWYKGTRQVLLARVSVLSSYFEDWWSLDPSCSTLLIAIKKHLHFDKRIFLSNRRRVQASLTKQGQYLGTLTRGMSSVGLSEAMHLGFFPLQFIITITTLISFSLYDITTLD